MASFTLKEPMGYDLYEGEWSATWQPEKGYRAIFRASAKFYDGIIREDKRVAQYVQRCNDAGQKYGLYHFLMPDDIDKQAGVFLNTASRIGLGHMPLIVDVEIYPANFGISISTWQKQVKTFLDIVQSYTGETPMIYTSREYWKYVSINNSPPPWTNNYPLWVAWYPYIQYVDSVSKPFLIPEGWTHWELWQYQDSGRSYGYPSNDYNVFSNEYVAILDEKYGGSTPANFPSDIYISEKDYRKVV